MKPHQKNRIKKETRLPFVKQRMESLLQFPAGTLSDEPHLEFSGRHRFLLEGNCTVQSCEETAIILHTADGNLRINGRDLCIITLSEEGILVSGCFVSLEFFD